MIQADYTQPHSRQIEVSLFGPGVGEAIVAHLGEGVWVTIDSCLDARTRRPIALTYLDALGVDLENQLLRSAITHWHDDHTKGIDEILACAPNSRLVCPAALQAREFKAAIGASASAASKVSPIDSTRKAFQELLRRPDSLERYPMWTSANRVIQRVGPTKLTALSPSDAEFTQTLHEVSKLIPSEGQLPRFPIRHRPNHASMVLQIESGHFSFLLGGDLEVGGLLHSGWPAICASTERSRSRSFGIKVAHHGSPNADTECIWSDLLVANPVAIATPYGRGRTPRPSEEDVERILARGCRLYLSAPAKGRKSKQYSAAERRAISLAARSLRSVGANMGHIRYRFDINTGLEEVALFGAARELPVP